MKTLVVDEKGVLSVKEVSMPVIGEYQALVKMIACGMCNGTDTKLIQGKFKGFTYQKDYPLMLGHEGVGRVVEIGAKVSGYKIGDIVLLPFADPIDGINTAWGAFSEYCVVLDDKALAEAGYAVGSEYLPEFPFAQSIVPADIDPVDAVMIITFREVLSSVKTFGIGANESVAIFGCGPVGMTFIRIMSLLGVNPIIAFDVDESKLDAAIANGADYVFNNKKIDAAMCVREICPGGVDYVIDAVGVLEIINQAFEMIRDRGRICCYGISSKSAMELDWSAAPYNWNICFQQMPSKLEEGEAQTQILSWLRNGAISLKDYISDYVEFKDIIKAFKRLEQGEIKQKCIITFPE
jgi:threonine dehydrogenase-like Zn-dependent dehydrogenase